MDTETRRIVCKRKLDEKKEELKVEKEALAKRMKETNDRVERIENEIDMDQKVIEQKEEVVEKLKSEIRNIKVQKNGKLIFIKNLKAQFDELEKDSDKRVSKIKEEVEFYQDVMNDSGVVFVTVESPSNREFLTFLDDTIREKEKELECPVCLEVAGAPVYMCPNSLSFALIVCRS